MNSPGPEKRVEEGRRPGIHRSIERNTHEHSKVLDLCKVKAGRERIGMGGEKKTEVRS